MAERKSGTLMTLDYRGWVFTHDGNWLTMRKEQTSFTVSGDTIRMSDLQTFAQGWVAADLFLGTRN